MKKVERIRETLSSPLTPEYLNRRAAAGWTLARMEWQVEWQREVEDEEAPAADETRRFFHEVPYGLKIAADCVHLEEEATEMQALTLMLDAIVQDRPFSRIADDLNIRGYRMRDGREWSAPSVFKMVPRLIEIAPSVFPREEWAMRKPQFAV